jgi:hypothetical protein
MQKYCETFLNLGMLQKVHPESLLYEQLQLHGIEVVKDWNIHYTLKRHQPSSL